ncbi:MAG: AI-2E family transporter [Lachnospiraceae bacterium]|nr:AI-2E family transporter [Lachnospiraceae bacterium]
MTDNRNKNNNFYFKFGINGLLIVCGGIFFYYILFHSDKLSALIGSFFSMLTPIISGLIIAYILNPIMRFLENRVFYPLWNIIKRQKDHKYSKEAIVIRFISAVLTMVLGVSLIYALVIMLIPQLISNIQSLTKRISTYFLNFNDYYSTFLATYPWLDGFVTQSNIDMSKVFYEKVLPYIETLLSKTSSSVLGSIVAVFKSVLNFIIGIIISMYLLIDKEKFCGQAKKVLYAFLKQERANNFINNLRYSDKIFGGFISGKVIDSIIIGILCYIGMIIMNMPYALLIAVVVGVTNVIPYFGPFIGAIPSAFIILMVNPKKCLIFIIFILILQQFDGNILGPKILGNSTGLNSFWVIFSITVFSGMFGVVGMFIGVPVFAVIYAAFKTLINTRLEIKHMPVNTEFYIKSDYVPEEEDINNSGKSFRFVRKTFDRVTKQTIEEDETRANAKNSSANKENPAAVDALLNEKDKRTEQ